MIDVNNIFDIFNNPNLENNNLKNNYNEVIDYYKNHPLYWVGMFKKLICNNQVFNDKILNSFRDMDEEINMKDIKDAGVFIMYSRAWFWILKIDVEKKLHQNALSYYADSVLLMYIKNIIFYFQEMEEYEKCAYLKKIQTFIESILK
jgi:hypothetical protein